MVNITISVNKEDIEYLDKRKINRSKFFRHAIDAYKDGIYEYQVGWQR